jgi:hypothetical protein
MGSEAIFTALHKTKSTPAIQPGALRALGSRDTNMMVLVFQQLVDSTDSETWPYLPMYAVFVFHF